MKKIVFLFEVEFATHWKGLQITFSEWQRAIIIYNQIDVIPESQNISCFGSNVSY